MDQIIHGDCFKVMPSLASESVDCLLTDPPYFIDGMDDEWKKGKSGSPRKGVITDSLGVGMKFDPKQGRRLQEFMLRLGREAMRLLRHGSFALVFAHPRLAHRAAVGLEEAGFEIRDLLIWHKPRGSQLKAFSLARFAKSDAERKLLGNRKTPQLRPMFEVIILGQKPRDGKFVDNWVKHGTGLIDVSKHNRTMFTAGRGNEKRIHPTQKPVELIASLLQVFTKKGDTIIDPFSGSGSTAVACSMLGRNCIAIEKDQEYHAASKERKP